MAVLQKLRDIAAGLAGSDGPVSLSQQDYKLLRKAVGRGRAETLDEKCEDRGAHVRVPARLLCEAVAATKDLAAPLKPAPESAKDGKSAKEGGAPEGPAVTAKTKKDDLIALAQAAGKELTGKETKEELLALLLPQS